MRIKWKPWQWSKKISIPILIILILFIGYRTFFHYQEQYEIGIARNQINGEIILLDKGGYYKNYPWVWVAIIDTRPTRVCVTSGSRSYNCKLVQFKPEYYQEFIANEGWRYYWWSNRFSINMSYDEEYRGVKDILRGYAYSVRKYPFVITIKEYNEDE